MSTPPAHPRYAAYTSRLESFNKWPLTTILKPSYMAEAGFFYLGTNDTVTCFHCNSTLFDWNATHDPWIQHAKFTDKCQYLLTGQQFTQPSSSASSTTVQVQPGPKSLSDLSIDRKAEQINQALSFGYDEKLITAAIVDNGSSLFPSVLELTDRIEKLRLKEATNGQAAVKSADPKFGSLAEENRYLKEQRMCKICMEVEVGVVFLPCGHLVSCPQCATALKICPICRTTVESHVRSYIA